MVKNKKGENSFSTVIVIAAIVAIASLLGKGLNLNTPPFCGSEPKAEGGIFEATVGPLPLKRILWSISSFGMRPGAGLLIFDHKIKTKIKIKKPTTPTQIPYFLRKFFTFVNESLSI